MTFYKTKYIILFWGGGVKKNNKKFNHPGILSLPV